MEGLSTELWESVRLTVELAGVTTVILLLIGTSLARWLARSKSIWSGAAAIIIALPLILPPPVLGFYLLGLLIRPQLVPSCAQLGSFGGKHDRWQSK